MKAKPQKQDERRGKDSASTVERRALCPGSRKAEKDKPNQSNALADSGTRIHEAWETDSPAKLNDEEKKIYERGARLRDELIQDWFDVNLSGDEQFTFDEIPDAPADEYKELRLWGLDERLSGQFDGAVIENWRAFIYDFKTGFSEAISAERNFQLRTLAVLVAENFPKVKEVTTAIIQPRVKPETSVACYTEIDLELARTEIIAIDRKADEPNAARQPGPIQCKYCKAKADCPEATNLTRSLAQWEGVNLPAERLPELLETCAVAKKIIAAVEAKAKASLEDDPTSVPGYTLKPGAKVQKVIDPQKLFNRCNERHSILPHEFIQVVDIGKTKFKALLKDATGLKGKELETELAALFEGVTKETHRAPSVTKVKN